MMTTMTTMTTPLRISIRTFAALALAVPVVLATGCATQPASPQVSPVNATVKLGRVSEKAFLSRVEVPDGGYAGYGGTGVGVGVGAGSGGWGGSGVGVGFAVDLTRLLNRPPPAQIDLFQYKVTLVDGSTATVNAPAAPGLEPGTCVRVVYPDGRTEPYMTPSTEC